MTADGAPPASKPVFAMIISITAINVNRVCNCGVFLHFKKAALSLSLAVWQVEVLIKKGNCLETIYLHNFVGMTGNLGEIF